MWIISSFNHIKKISAPFQKCVETLALTGEQLSLLSNHVDFPKDISMFLAASYISQTIAWEFEDQS